MVGDSKTKSMRLTSQDNPFRVIEFSFLLNSSPDFIVLSMPEGQDIPAGRPVYFDVAFRPTSPGVKQATLRISTRVEGMTSMVTLKLKGYGGSSAVDQSAKEIIDFIRNSAAEGTLEGTGEGGTAQKRMNNFAKIFKDAFKALEKGKGEDACEKLEDALKKMDNESGSGNPKALVRGEATQELREKVQKLRKQLGCPE
jgi:hypothetical protein